MKSYMEFIKSLLSPLEKLEEEKKREYYILVAFLTNGRVQGMVSDFYFELYMEQFMFEKEEVLDSFIYSGTKEQIKNVLKKSKLNMRDFHFSCKIGEE